MSQNQQEQTEAKLLDYVDGELDDATRAEIEKHLQANPNHRRVLAELGRGRNLLRWLPREAAPAELLENIQSQLERGVLLEEGDELVAAAEPLRMNRWTQIRAAAAVVLLAAGLGVVIYAVLPRGNGHLPIVMQSPATRPAGEKNGIGLGDTEASSDHAATSQTDAFARGFDAAPGDVPITGARGSSASRGVDQSRDALGNVAAAPPSNPDFTLGKEAMDEKIRATPAAAMWKDGSAAAVQSQIEQEVAATALRSVSQLNAAQEQGLKQRGAGKTQIMGVETPSLYVVVSAAEPDAARSAVTRFLVSNNVRWDSADTAALLNQQTSATIAPPNEVAKPTAGGEVLPGVSVAGPSPTMPAPPSAAQARKVNPPPVAQEPSIASAPSAPPAPAPAAPAPAPLGANGRGAEGAAGLPDRSTPAASSPASIAGGPPGGTQRLPNAGLAAAPAVPAAATPPATAPALSPAVADQAPAGDVVVARGMNRRQAIDLCSNLNHPAQSQWVQAYEVPASNSEYGKGRDVQAVPAVAPADGQTPTALPAPVAIALADPAAGDNSDHSAAAGGASPALTRSAAVGAGAQPYPATSSARGDAAPHPTDQKRMADTRPLEAQPIRAGDALRVVVRSAADGAPTVYPVIVGERGTVHLPPVGDIPLAGRTPHQAGQMLISRWPLADARSGGVSINVERATADLADRPSAPLKPPSPDLASELPPADPARRGGIAAPPPIDRPVDVVIVFQRAPRPAPERNAASEPLSQPADAGGASGAAKR